MAANKPDLKVAEPQPTHVQMTVGEWNDLMATISNTVIHAQASVLLQKFSQAGKPITLGEIEE